MTIFSSLKNKTLLISSISALALILSTTIQAGKYYRWVDESGVTHYTETPPPDTQATTIRTQGKDPKSAEQAKARLSEQRKAFTEAAANKKAADEENKLADENEKIKQGNCETAKKNLKMLQEHSRIREKGDNGEYTVLAEEERQARIKLAQERIKEFCN